VYSLTILKSQKIIIELFIKACLFIIYSFFIWQVIQQRDVNKQSRQRQKNAYNNIKSRKKILSNIEKEERERKIPEANRKDTYTCHSCHLYNIFIEEENL
jgi:hypothetical protein